MQYERGVDVACEWRELLRGVKKLSNTERESRDFCCSLSAVKRIIRGN